MPRSETNLAAVAPQFRQRKPPRRMRGAAALGLSVIFIAIGGIGVWGSTAPLNSAVVAQGTFVASSKNKIIQHLEGGIVEGIFVNEGDLVERGQRLIRLNGTAAQAQLRRLQLRRYMLLAMRARLTAEQAASAAIAFPEGLLEAAAMPEVKEIVDRQKSEFDARWQKLESQIAVLARRKSAVREEITGLEAQREAVSEELSFIEKELEATDSLFKKGLTSLAKLLALKRAQSKLKGNAGSLTAQIGRAKERIQEFESETHKLRFERIEAAVSELRTIEAELAEIEEQIKASRDIFQRLDVRAPVRGIVVKLTQHTQGGVVSSGQEMIELLPLDDELIIEAYVRPNDIDAVRVGQESWVRLTALDQRVTPTVKGNVTYVSADRLQEDPNKEAFYVTRVQINEEQARELGPSQTLPGMPAEVYIKTGERTLVAYLLRPFQDSLSRGMLER